MKLLPRVLSWLRRFDLAYYDEPTVLVIDDVVVSAMNEGASLVVGLHRPPLLTWTSSTKTPSTVLFPQRQPRGDQ